MTTSEAGPAASEAGPSGLSLSLSLYLSLALPPALPHSSLSLSLGEKVKPSSSEEQPEAGPSGHVTASEADPSGTASRIQPFPTPLQSWRRLFLVFFFRLVGEEVQPSSSEEHPEAGPVGHEAGPSSSHVTTSETGPAGNASRIQMHTQFIYQIVLGSEALFFGGASRGRRILRSRDHI